MDINKLIPTPEILTVDYIIFRVLLVTTFFFHILSVNLLIGSSLISVYINIKNKFTKSSNLSLAAKDLSEKIPFIFAFTINLGIAPFLFLQVIYGNYIYTSSILMGAYWLSLMFVLIAGYSLIYYYKSGFDNFSEKKRFVTTALFTLLLIYTAFIFSGNISLMLEPEKWIVYFKNPQGTFLDLTNPVLYARCFHFINGSVAISGLFIALTYHIKGKKIENYNKDIINAGFRIFTLSTSVQILSGVLFYFLIPEKAIQNLTLNFYILLFASFITIAASLYFAYKKRLIPLTLFTLFTIFFMVILRDLLRYGYLSKYLNLHKFNVVYQLSPFVLFITVLLLCTLFMIYTIKREKKKKNDQTRI